MEHKSETLKQLKQYLKKYTSVVIGLFITAFSFNLFFVPTNIAYGGTNGLAVVLQNIFDSNLQLTLALVLLSFLVIGFVYLDKRTVSKAIIGSILYPVFVIITANISNYIIIDYTKDLLLIYAFGAILLGFGSGLIYKKGFSVGGLDILKQVCYDKYKISMGKSTFIFNAIIIITGAIVTNNYSNIMYALVIIYINGYITDRVILGISEQKIFQIVTTKEKEIKEFIINELGHDVTTFNAQGGFFNKQENILLCVIPTKQYFVTKEAIKAIDKNAFFVVADAYESMGNK